MRAARRRWLRPLRAALRHSDYEAAFPWTQGPLHSQELLFVHMNAANIWRNREVSEIRHGNRELTNVAARRRNRFEASCTRCRIRVCNNHVRAAANAWHTNPGLGHNNCPEIPYGRNPFAKNAMWLPSGETANLKKPYAPDSALYSSVSCPLARSLFISRSTGGFARQLTEGL